METLDPSPNSTPSPLLLSYAPPVRVSLRRFLVIPFGLFTTALALLIAQATNAMGWHYFYILPLGAIIIGAIAGSGYMFAGQFAGLRARRHVFWIIVLIQILAFFAAQYIEFFSKGPLYELATGKPLGFWRYFHLITTSMTLATEGSNNGEQLGVGGYVYRLIELVGFVGSGVLLLLLLKSENYCNLCSRYRESKLLTFIPASAPYPSELNDRTRADFEERSAALMESAENRLEILDQFAVDGNLPEFLKELDQGLEESAGAGKLPTRIRLELSYCPACHAGTMLQSVRVGQQLGVEVTMLPSIELNRDFVAGIVKRKKNAVM